MLRWSSDKGIEYDDKQTRLPFIIPNHIDGPLLHFRDGQLHWLTLWERFWFWCGKTDAYKLEYKYRPELAEWDQ